MYIIMDMKIGEVNELSRLRWITLNVWTTEYLTTRYAKKNGSEFLKNNNLKIQINPRGSKTNTYPTQTVTRL